MDKRYGFQILLLILVFCFCAGSLAFLPMTDLIAVPSLEVLEIDSDQTEFEEDLLLLILSVTSIAGLVFIKLASMHPGLRSASLSPVSPPPKIS
jgi:hypothetical protein